MPTRLQKWGNSLWLPIRKSLAEQVGIGAGSEVDLSVSNGDLVVRPRRLPRYRLEDLLDRVNSENLHAEIEKTMNNNFNRRQLILALASGAVAGAVPLRAAEPPQETQMYGLIGKINVAPGKREEVVEALLAGSRSMPGCLSYIVAQDPSDPNAIWVTEAWDSQESHQASLALPSVQEAIAKAKPYITGFGERFETVPVGGYGLVNAGS